MKMQNLSQKTGDHYKGYSVPGDYWQMLKIKEESLHTRRNASYGGCSLLKVANCKFFLNI